MPLYRVEQTATAVILWEGEAESEDQALELAAQAAGYTSRDEMVRQIGDDEGVQAFEVA